MSQLEHAAICGGDKSVPAGECGCNLAIFATEPASEYLKRRGLSEQKLSCCKMDNCKKCSSKLSPLKHFLEFAEWLHSKLVFRNADK